MLSALARGRLTTLAGVLLLCTDTPTYRKLRLSLPVSDARFGFAVALWRGITATLSCGAAVAWMEGWSTTAMRTHVTALGVRNMLLAAALMAAASMCFTVAVGLTSAAAVLVIIALGPLITALLCRVILGAKLPAHTWAACIAGFAAVALVFAGSMEASSAVGCLVAVGCPLCFGAYLTLATHISQRSDVSLTPGMPISGLLVLFVALCALGKDVGAAAPADARDAVLIIVNGSANALANLLVTIGSQNTPAAEVALIGLLETALSPFLVYAVVGEKPSVQTVTAGGLIVTILLLHALYDLYLERHARSGAGGGAEQEEGVELLAAAPAEASDEDASGS